MRSATPLIVLSLLASTLHATALAKPSTPNPSPSAKQIILFVWDGLRPDSINRKDTPNLYHLKQRGSYFSDNHSSYPTLTMVNASSFATGDLAGKTGFYGNVIWDPNAKGDNAEGKSINFREPVFTEDYHILADLNTRAAKGPLLEVQHLFATLHKKGVKTATVGKSGPAALQDYQPKNPHLSIVLDEKHVYPLSFAHWLQKKHYPLPKMSPHAYPEGKLTLSKNNGNPTGFGRESTLHWLSSRKLGSALRFSYPDRVTSDPEDTSVSPYDDANRYLMKTYLTQIVPHHHPRMSIVWLRNPDTTEHTYGVGSRSYYTALHSQDHLLGWLIASLKKHHLWKTTDLIVASDHSHSNVSGPLSDYPLRAIHRHAVTRINRHGYSVSGDFRPADLLHRAGFHAYDGAGCIYDPVLSGIKRDGSLVYPVKRDRDGSVCHHNISLKDTYGDRTRQLEQQRYSSVDLRVPNKLPKDGIVVAGNGGTTYFYIPSHDPKLIQRVVRFIQSREEFGPVFVHQRYGSLPGTLSLKQIGLYNSQGKNPDIVASSHYDNNATIKGFHGTEFNSSGINRGMHGSFSHTDVHNTLIAYGPDFKSHFIDPLPSANLDVPNTIAYLFNTALVHTSGRVLLEALRGGAKLSDYKLQYQRLTPAHAANDLVMKKSTNPDGKDIMKGVSHFNEQLTLKQLTHGKQTTVYFDSAKEQRY